MQSFALSAVLPTPGSQPVQPVYQPPIPPAQPQKKKGKGCLIAFLIVIGVIIVIAIIASLGSKDEPAKLASGTTTASATKTTSSNSDNKTVFGVNQAVVKNNVELTVTKVKKSSGSEYDKPKSGMEFVIVTVKYKNTSSDEKVSYNPYDFKMKNSKGQITDQTFTTVNQDTELSSGDLAPGGQIEGTIAFEQPKGDKALVLQYTGNIFKTDSEIDFKLN